MNFFALQPFWFQFLAQTGEVTVIDGADPISTDPGAFVNYFATVGLSLGVVIAVVLVATAGYKMMNSKGDPKAIQDAQEQIGNAIMGFMLVLAAVVIVKIIMGAIGVANIVKIN